jgi:hypothetical protein
MPACSRQAHAFAPVPFQAAELVEAVRKAFTPVFSHGGHGGHGGTEGKNKVLFVYTSKLLFFLPPCAPCALESVGKVNLHKKQVKKYAILGVFWLFLSKNQGVF